MCADDVCSPEQIQGKQFLTTTILTFLIISTFSGILGFYFGIQNDDAYYQGASDKYDALYPEGYEDGYTYRYDRRYSDGYDHGYFDGWNQRNIIYGNITDPARISPNIDGEKDVIWYNASVQDWYLFNDKINVVYIGHNESHFHVFLDLETHPVPLQNPWIMCYIHTDSTSTPDQFGESVYGFVHHSNYPDTNVLSENVITERKDVPTSHQYRTISSNITSMTPEWLWDTNLFTPYAPGIAFSLHNDWHELNVSLDLYDALTYHFPFLTTDEIITHLDNTFDMIATWHFSFRNAITGESITFPSGSQFQWQTNDTIQLQSPTHIGNNRYQYQQHLTSEDFDEAFKLNSTFLLNANNEDIIIELEHISLNLEDITWRKLAASSIPLEVEYGQSFGHTSHCYFEFSIPFTEIGFEHLNEMPDDIGFLIGTRHVSPNVEQPHRNLAQGMWFGNIPHRPYRTEAYNWYPSEVWV